MADYAKDVLVDTDWVAEHLDDDSIRIVEVDENPRSVRGGATSPARSASTGRTTFRTRSSETSSSAEDFGSLMGSRGISNDHTVVLYGDRNNWFAAYTYWYFLYYGHDKVKLVNGPREKWIAEGRETTHRGRRATRRRPSRAQPGDESIRAHRDEVHDGARRRHRTWSTCAARRSTPAS